MHIFTAQVYLPGSLCRIGKSRTSVFCAGEDCVRRARCTIAVCGFVQIIHMKPSCALVILFAVFLIVGQASADLPSWAGGSKKGAQTEREEEWDDDGERALQRDDDYVAPRERVRSATKGHARFDARQRRLAVEYFDEQFRRGRCPPGLEKKHNGCLPPAKVKKWVIGRPLPREVIHYELPSTLVLRFGPPPHGYYYVRVANDLLLITVGTAIVVDAIRGLGRK